MKKGFYVVMILFATLVAISCGSSTQSYSDMLDEEKKAIEQLIDENGFEILKKFPADSVFEDNQFVKLDNGVYLNIIDKGSDDRAEYGTKLIYRCTLTYPMDSSYNVVFSITNYGPHSNGTYPLSFYYGETSSTSNIYVSEGLQTPLEYVGDKAKVKLIVPFKYGCYYDQTYGEPAYYEILQYFFEDNL